MAARNGHLRCLKVLVDGGADIDIKNTEQKTALQVAFEEQHMNCVRYLTTVEGNNNYYYNASAAEVVSTRISLIIIRPGGS